MLWTLTQDVEQALAKGDLDLTFLVGWGVVCACRHFLRPLYHILVYVAFLGAEGPLLARVRSGAPLGGVFHTTGVVVCRTWLSLSL